MRGARTWSLRSVVVALAIGGLTGCVSDRVLALEIRPPRDLSGEPDVPADVTVWEVRLERLEGDASCPDAGAAAAGRVTGRLAHVQAFDSSEGMGMPVGEVPSGRWALSVLARTDTCTVRLHGCTELLLDGDASEQVVVQVAAVDVPETCGCRSCEAGRCARPETVCE